MNSVNITVDSINQRTMRGAVGEYSSIVDEGLNGQEQAALDGVIERVRNGRILDIGVGAGRTVRPLQALSDSYVGVDYVQEMVDHCRRAFPDARFEKVDARAMRGFKDGTFDLVFFSCNGMSMVDHAGRLAILAEVRRLLAAGGTFIFSTCNRNSPQYEATFRFPEFQSSTNPAKLVMRSGRFLGQTMFRLMNRLRYIKQNVRTPDYAVINDVCHHYQTMLYFITVEAQLRQLIAAGFEPDITVYDLSGRPVSGTTRDGTVAFVATNRA